MSNQPELSLSDVLEHHPDVEKHIEALIEESTDNSSGAYHRAFDLPEIQALAQDEVSREALISVMASRGIRVTFTHDHMSLQVNADASAESYDSVTL